MQSPINNFSEEYRFLSNFYPCTVVYKGISYPSAEHAYQAHKCVDPRIHIIFSYLHTAGEAKRLGKNIKMREDWNSIKETVMSDVVSAKFMQTPSLQELLLKTGDCELIEGNHWGDVFWGVCNGEGQNKLGKILMNVRAAIRFRDQFH